MTGEIHTPPRGDALLELLLTLEIGDALKIAGGTQMRRVPGGWVYETWLEDAISTCFISITDHLANASSDWDSPR